MARSDIDKLRRQLPLPPMLAEMLRDGHWKSPGHDVMAEKVPFIHDPLEFLSSIDSMLSNSGPLMGTEKSEDEVFSEYRGSRIPFRDLPWIDVEKVIFIIINEQLGDDVGIALDYRTGNGSPRLVATDYHSGRNLVYREVAPSFEAFVELIGLRR